METLDERPWERLGSVRRDCEPHRSGRLLFLGRCSSVCGALSLCFLLPSIVGLPLGITVWVMARRDLTAMRMGVMDPQGRSQTKQGRNHAIVGMALSLVPIPFFVMLHSLLNW